MGGSAVLLVGTIAGGSDGLVVSRASASQINVEKVIFDRLNKKGAFGKIYNGSGYTAKSIKLMGTVQTNGIKFKLPNVVPQKPLVLQQQNLANCNDQTSTLNASVNKSTENSETFSKTATITSTTTVTVGYESPIGVSGEASQALEISGSKTEEKTHSETVSWEAGVNVPVGPRKAVLIQFVVSEAKLDVPWWTDVIVSGRVDAFYERPAKTTVCLYEHINYKGRKKCITASKNWNSSNFKKLKWEGSKKNINDEVSSVKVSGPARVTLYQHKNYKGKSWSYSHTKGWVGKKANDRFSSIKIVPTPGKVTKSVNVEQYLTGADQRIALKGTYKGVNGVQGDFRTSSPIVLTDSDCGLVVTGPSSKSANSVRASRSVSGSEKGKAAARIVAGAAAQKLVPFASKPIATVMPKKKTDNLKRK